MSSGNAQRTPDWIVGFARVITATIFLFACLSALRRYGLPAPAKLIETIQADWVDGPFGQDVAVSVSRSLLGWAPGFLLGVACGIATGRLRAAAVIAEGPLTLMRSIPFISLVPLSVRIFGLSEVGKVLLVAYATLGATWVVVHQSAAALPIELLWRSRVLGISELRRFTKVTLPALATPIFSAGRSSIGLAWIVLGVAELGGVYERTSAIWWSEGLGYRLFRSLDDGRDDLLLIAILLFAGIGLLGDAVFAGIWKTGAAVALWSARRRARRRSSAGRALERPPHIDREPASLNVHTLSAAYGADVVLRDVNLAVPPGTTLSIVGPSGSGKTTLIRSLAHLTGGGLVIDGKVEIDGRAVLHLTPQIGVVFQEAAVFGDLTVWDNLMLGERLSNASQSEADARGWTLLEEFGLSTYADRLAGSLSGGERQRLAMAMVLANDVRVLLLDEPFGALDALTRRRLQKYYIDHVSRRTTTVLVTHDLEEALLLGDYVRIGTSADANVFEVGKDGLHPFEWERQPEFAAARLHLLAELERVMRNDTAAEGEVLRSGGDGRL